MSFARRDRKFAPRTQSGLTPMQVAKAYSIPVGVDVSKRTVAIIELDGAFNLKDIARYCTQNSIKMGKISAVFCDGAAENFDDADGEVDLDICVIAAIAQGVNIIVIFAPNTNQGFVDAALKALDTLMPCRVPGEPRAINGIHTLALHLMT